MPMRMISDFGNIRARLSLVQDKIVRSLSNGLEKEAARVRDESRRRAPLEYGNLEEAIIYERDSGKKHAYIIFVDEDAPDDTGEYTVGDYYEYLHEGIMWNPGPKTKWPRGRKYLERGFNAAIKGATARLAAAARREVRELR